MAFGWNVSPTQPQLDIAVVRDLEWPVSKSELKTMWAIHVLLEKVAAPRCGMCGTSNQHKSKIVLKYSSVSIRKQ